MNKKFNIIIPMAGESSRFNYQFKPFLKLDSRTFLEHVIDSFPDSRVSNYYFIITEQQEKDNDFSNRVKELLPDLSSKTHVIKLKKKTLGPYETVSSALSQVGDIKNAIVCDSDHYVSTEQIIKKAESKHLDLVIPVWAIKNEEQKNWGKLVYDNNNNRIINFYEKEVLPQEEGKTIYGTLGCYYIKCTSILKQGKGYVHFSDFFKNNFSNLQLDIAFIKKAYFFGSPEMAELSIKKRRKWETIFCDIDGVLINHKNHSTNHSNTLTKECIEQLKRWRRKNKKIILSTARHYRSKASLEKHLKDMGVEYDELVMGLNPGPRYLINDIKPSNPFVKQAVAINLPRDYGISKVVLNENENYETSTLKQLKGNSFSKTLLLKNKDKLFVRKSIPKVPELQDHYDKLRRQCEDLKRFTFYDPFLSPKVVDEQDTRDGYFFDIEYFENHKQLDTFPPDVQRKVLEAVVDRLSEFVYCYKKPNKGEEFINDFFDTKIYPKLTSFAKDCPIMKMLIDSETVLINGVKNYGLRKVLNELNIFNFNTPYLNPIHGDLTLENILYNSDSQDFKLIDMEGSRYVDSCYLDLAKIFQSTVSGYKDWNSLQNVIFSASEGKIECPSDFFSCDPSNFQSICSKYSDLMGESNWKKVFRKGIFYMAMYFIRFVPFRKQVSDDHAVFALVMAVKWLNFLKYEN
jgi:thiamine kinase-like enzyme/molybdopterin-guanine dinucleotide biosynthesis protein A